jgi:hypothetical protein
MERISKKQKNPVRHREESKRTFPDMEPANERACG